MSKINEPQTVRTGDGYSFTRQPDGTYTDGDLVFASYEDFCDNNGIPQIGEWSHVEFIVDGEVIETRELIYDACAMMGGCADSGDVAGYAFDDLTPLPGGVGDFLMEFAHYHMNEGFETELYMFDGPEDTEDAGHIPPSQDGSPLEGYTVSGFRLINRPVEGGK